MFPKTLQVLYSGGPEECQTAFQEFASTWINGNEDPALKNFLRQNIMTFKENFGEQFANSNLLEFVEV